jgi:hypothetical protein
LREGKSKVHLFALRACIGRRARPRVQNTKPKRQRENHEASAAATRRALYDGSRRGREVPRNGIRRLGPGTGCVPAECRGQRNMVYRTTTALVDTKLELTNLPDNDACTFVPYALMVHYGR